MRSRISLVSLTLMIVARFFPYFCQAKYTIFTNVYSDNNDSGFMMNIEKWLFPFRFRHYQYNDSLNLLLPFILLCTFVLRSMLA